MVSRLRLANWTACGLIDKEKKRGGGKHDPQNFDVEVVKWMQEEGDFL